MLLLICWNRRVHAKGRRQHLLSVYSSLVEFGLDFNLFFLHQVQLVAQGHIPAAVLSQGIKHVFKLLDGLLGSAFGNGSSVLLRNHHGLALVLVNTLAAQSLDFVFHIPQFFADFLVLALH